MLSATVVASMRMMTNLNPYNIRRTFDPSEVAQQTDKHMWKLPCFWPPDWVGSDKNYALIDDHNNVGLMDYYRPFIYETHIYFEDRGGEALRRVKAMIGWAFENTDALMLVGKTPVLEKGAWLLTRMSGMKRISTIDTAWGPMHMSALTKEEWYEGTRNATGNNEC